MCQEAAQQAHLSTLRDVLHADIAHLRRAAVGETTVSAGAPPPAATRRMVVIARSAASVERVRSRLSITASARSAVLLLQLVRGAPPLAAASDVHGPKMSGATALTTSHD
jgi:hypothetical protein